MLRNDGTQIAESAAARMQSDSIVVNQTEILWPDSCQMISGRVLPMTAAHAMIRGHGLDVAGVAGFIWLGTIAASFTEGARAPRLIFPVWEFRLPACATIRSRPECDRETSRCLSPARENRRRRAPA